MQQKELISFLNAELKKNKLSHAYLFSCDDQDVLNDFSNSFIKSIFCENNSIDGDDCLFCSKFENNNILSFISIEAEKGLIGKNKIDNLISSFSTTSLEKNINKVYVIKNCENLTNSAANSLIKFLEEPPLNTYAILLNKSNEHVIETIVSRCERFHINTNSKLEETKLIDLINQKDVDELCLYSLKLLSYDKEKVIYILNSAYNHMLLQGNKLALDILETVNFVKKNNLYLLALDSLIIKIIREIEK